MKNSMRAFALVAAMSTSVACIGQTTEDPISTVSSAILVPKDLAAYDFTYLHFANGELTAGLVSVDPADVPIKFTLEGEDESGKSTIETEVELLSIDSKAGVATYKRASGAELDLYFDVSGELEKPSAKTKVVIVVDPAAYRPIVISDCFLPPPPPDPGRKPPNPCRVFFIPKIH